MTTQLPPEEMVSQNELICAKLLGWELRPRFGNNPRELYRPDGSLANEPLTFTTWAEAGLILDALQSVVGWESARARSQFGWLLKTSELTPLAIRAEALEYIRRQA